MSHYARDNELIDIGTRVRGTFGRPGTVTDVYYAPQAHHLQSFYRKVVVRYDDDDKPQTEIYSAAELEVM